MSAWDACPGESGAPGSRGGGRAGCRGAAAVPVLGRSGCLGPSPVSAPGVVRGSRRRPAIWGGFLPGRLNDRVLSLVTDPADPRIRSERAPGEAESLDCLLNFRKRFS